MAKRPKPKPNTTEALRHARRPKPDTCVVAFDVRGAGAVIEATTALWSLLYRLEDPQTGSGVDAASELRAILERMLKP